MNDDRPKTLVELGEELRQTWRTLFDEMAKSLGLIRLVDWLNDRLTKEDEN